MQRRIKPFYVVETERLIFSGSGEAMSAILLRYVEGLKPQRVAERLDISAAAARMLLSRVRAVLRECIERTMRRAAEA